MMEFNLRELLDKQKKSVYWLANETGIHYNNVSRIVNNETKSIKLENIEKLCKAFGCKPNDLFVIKK